ncbi:MAG: hypothetical protein AABX73_01930 [Nanoarchaeota archaeon]
MNKKADIQEILTANIVYVILLLIFFLLMLFFLRDQMNGSSVWADFYAKEITKTINYAQPGDTITINIHKATKIAKSNELKSFSEIFAFDNSNSQICVKLSKERETCNYYFNNIDVINPEIKLGVPENILVFKISEKIKNEQ